MRPEPDPTILRGKKGTDMTAVYTSYAEADRGGCGGTLQDTRGRPDVTIVSGVYRPARR